jgi:flagella basal body P-ring formation protein FlgA
MLMSHLAVDGKKPRASACGCVRLVAAAALWALAAGTAAAAGAASGAGATADRTADAVEAAARRSLGEQAERAGLVEPEFDVAVVKAGPALPACAGRLAVDDVDTRSASRMRFAATCSGAEGWRREVVVRASVSARVLVAAADVPANRPLRDADVTLERRDVTAAHDTLSDPQAIDGMASRRALRQGDVLHRGALVAPTLVKRGDAVRIVARQGGIEVTVPGEALDAGARDEAIRVRNTTTGTVIRARVSGAGVVEPVEIEGAASGH